MAVCQRDISSTRAVGVRTGVMFTRKRSRAFAGAVTLVVFASAGCKRGQSVVEKPEVSVETAPVTGNPFVGIQFFVPPYTNADQARRRLQATNPQEAQLIAKIADTPQARWLGDWSGEPKTAAGNFVNAAAKKSAGVLFIAYNITNRDCGLYSKGGATDPEAYRRWIASLADGIGRDKRAVVVLEPDALGHLTECLSEVDQKQRLDLLREAVETLEALPGVSVYLDAGHSRWVPAVQMAERLEAAGIKQARGFALNTSNYVSDDELIAYGDEIVSHIGETHYIIDSSRNGNGPAPEDPTNEKSWCNPPDRALGRKPTADTGNPNLDAFVWLKNPGESDGECQGGPPAGQWYHERALELAKNAKW